ncbi:MAG: transposase [Deltaproteobacteria bacterium]|nr:MAG: transposase [Deltaproteobacteria bacterium]
MKAEISVPEWVNLFNKIQGPSEELFKMIRVDIRENVGRYLSNLMDMELAHFLGREPHERGQIEVDHRKGPYNYNFTLKCFREVEVNVPGNRKGDFETRIIPCIKKHEDALREKRN